MDITLLLLAKPLDKHVHITYPPLAFGMREDCGSGASEFRLHSFIAFRRYLAGRSPAYGRGAASVFPFGTHSFFKGTLVA